MIFESSYWKEPLLEMAERIRQFKTVGELSEEQLAQIERDIFIGFYSVRKLIEAETKVTDATKHMKVNVEWHPNQRPVNWLNNHKVDELYNLDQMGKETREIWFICGRIIHSFVFTPVQDESGFSGVLFTSDIDKDRKLYYIAADDVIRVFEHVGNDYPSTITWNKDPATGEETTSVQ